MPVFEYTALDAKGKTISGVVDADSTSSARQKLRGSKIFPISLKEPSDSYFAKKETKGFSRFASLTRIKASEISMFTRQLSTIMGAGFPLVSAIDTLIPTIKSQAFKRILSRIKDAIVEGKSFAASLSIYPTIFSSLYINMVRAGESSGTLEIVLERLADITENQQALNHKVKSAMTYPIFMGIIGMLVLFLLMTFVVPSITSIFIEMKQTLPKPTLFLIATSKFFKSSWWLMILIMIGMIFSIKAFKKTKKGRLFYDKTMLFSPGIGTLIQKLAVARFTRTLGSLLENGIPMLSALDIVKNIVGNVVIYNVIEESAKEVGKGRTLSSSLSIGKALPYLSIQMIQVGEQSGELEKMLNKIADVYEGEVESTIMGLTSLLEPIMILVMGVIVAFIVLSICLPIIEMNQLVR
ncbi:MAG: type II secretion system inner membrane protein GspF [Desulfobacterales bacterium]|nr:type II secretion system inner membrane protein GspF [Desulfobacterales bacterium]MBF0396699.1 type II secretion system inner membrane protein GspF [Desulfobacterales bacterium]